MIQTRLVFPSDLNPGGRLFGGRLLAWMDETAYLLAYSYAGLEVVTRQIRDVIFRQAVFPGEIIEIESKISKSSQLSIWIEVNAKRLAKNHAEKEVVARALFQFCAVGEKGQLLSLRDE